jgi:hypothetical protein
MIIFSQITTCTSKKETRPNITTINLERDIRMRIQLQRFWITNDIFIDLMKEYVIVFVNLL